MNRPVFCSLVVAVFFFTSLSTFLFADEDDYKHQWTGSQTMVDNPNGASLDDITAESLLDDIEPTPARVTRSPVKTPTRRPAPTRRTATATRRTVSTQKPVTTRRSSTKKPSSTGRTQRKKDTTSEDVATGVALVGVLGVCGYVATAGKAAAAAKAIAVAKGVAVAGGTGAGVGAGTASGGSIAADTSLPADFVDEGEFTEADAEVPTGPKAGDVRTYFDATGTKWTEVFNGRNWIDRASFEDAHGKIAENKLWQAEQRLKQLNHDTAFDRAMDQKKLNHAKDIQDIHNRNFKEIRDNGQLLQDSRVLDQGFAESALERIETVNDVIDAGKTLVDVTLPIIGAAAGPPGWVVGTTYTLATGVGEGVATGFVEPSKGIVTEGLKGLGKGVVNVIVSEGVGSLLATGSRVFRAAANAVKGPSGFIKVFKKTVFNAPVPVKELGQMAKNFKSGVSLAKGVDVGTAFTTLTDVASGFSVSGQSLATTAGRNMAKKAYSTLGEGVLASVKANAIDSNLGRAINEGLWGK